MRDVLIVIGFVVLIVLFDQWSRRAERKLRDELIEARQGLSAELHYAEPRVREIVRTYFENVLQCGPSDRMRTIIEAELHKLDEWEARHPE